MSLDSMIYLSLALDYVTLVLNLVGFFSLTAMLVCIDNFVDASYHVTGEVRRWCWWHRYHYKPQFAHIIDLRKSLVYVYCTYVRAELENCFLLTAGEESRNVDAICYCNSIQNRLGYIKQWTIEHWTWNMTFHKRQTTINISTRILTAIPYSLPIISVRPHGNPEVFQPAVSDVAGAGDALCGYYCHGDTDTKQQPPL